MKKRSTTPRTTITSAMVAERLNISRATVSYVINGQAQQKKIPVQTERRVLAMAREMGYVPNQLARSLRLQHSGVIGLVTRGLGYNWIERILVGMLPVLDEAGYTPLLSTNYWDARREERELQSLLERRVDAMIVLPMPYNIVIYREIIERGIPLVFLGDTLEGLDDVHSVVWDTGRATETALRHLLDTGRRRIGFIGADHQTVWTRRRYEVYEQVLREAGLAVRPEWVAWELFDFSYQIHARIERMVDRVFAKPSQAPEALFVSTDALATVILGILDERGIKVPDDVAVIGLGDYFMSDHPGISLSTVREPTERMGRLAAETAVELVSDPEGPVRRHLFLDAELVARGTTGASGRRPGP